MTIYAKYTRGKSMKKSVKILSTLLALTFAFGYTISAADVLPGDLNGDATVNSADAIYLLRHSIMAENYPIHQSGDMNGDGNINSADAIYLLRHTILPEQYPLKNLPECETHSVVIDEAVAPTCTESGLTEGKHCEICLKTLVKQEEIPSPGHQIENGFCTVCGEKAMDSEGLAYELSADGTYYIVAGKGSCKDTYLVIPSEYQGLPVKEIKTSAFAYSNVKGVWIPDSITAIGKDAFSSCVSLKSVSLGNGITELSNRLFSSCYYLETITIPDSVTKIGSYVFYSCFNLKNVTLSQNITEIGEGAFSECHVLTALSLPEGLISIGNSAFHSCEAMGSLEIPSSVTQIGEYAFFGCASLVEMTIPDTITVISDGMFAECSSLATVKLPADLQAIGSRAFSQTALTEIDIPDVATIGIGAFYDCQYLQTVSLPDTLTYIQTNTFKNCDSLQTVTVPEGIISIAISAFESCDALKTLILPSTLQVIDVYAFNDCCALENIVYNGSEGEWLLINKGSYWDENTGDYTMTYLKMPTVTEDLLYQLSEDGRYYIVMGIGTSQATDIIIPATHNDLPVLTIADEAFNNCDQLVSLKIENGIQRIGKQAFYQCSRLVSVDMASSIQEIGEGAFENCSELRNINLPDDLTTLPNSIFKNCSKLSDLALPLHLKHIGDHAFNSCYELTPMLPEGLESIGEMAFTNCRFTEITLPETLVMIGEGAFSSCNRLQSIVLPDSLMTLGARAFANCSWMNAVTLSQNLVVIEAETFFGCSSLISITIPESVACIESRAFGNIYNLSITYDGTKYAWMMIEKAEDWDKALTYTLTFTETDDSTKDIFDPNSYAGTYAYNYLGTLPKGEALQKYYDKLDALCYQFHLNGTDIQPMQSGQQEIGVLGILNFSELGLTFEEAQAVYVAYILDRPLYYWLENAIAYSDTSIYVLVAPEYYLASARNEWNQKIYAKIQEWTSLVSDEHSAYQIALAYHDLIVSEIDYAYEKDGVTPQDDHWAHSIIGTFGGIGEGVCESYAKAFHLLLNYSGVENVYVIGDAGGAHAWNMVKLDDGNWYWCDLTWDDNPEWAWGIDYHYFCINSTQNTYWYYQDGGYIIDGNNDGILDVETFMDTHTPDSVCGVGMNFAYPLPQISTEVYEGTLRDTFVVNNRTYAISGYRTVQFVGSGKNGTVTIPETVLYNGITYTVTSIGAISRDGIYIPYPTTIYANAIFVPKTVKYIWEGAFDENVIVTVDAENPYYYSENGRVYSKVPTMMHFGAKNICRPKKLRILGK